MVIGLLGILKAGGAYVPLDPAYPAARLAFMLEDAQVLVLLTQSSLKEKLLPETKTQVICLDVQAETLSQYRSNNLNSGVGPENLAYVIYTSGSTGKPKGVMIEHAALSNLNHSAVKIYPIFQEDRILQFASINFLKTPEKRESKNKNMFFSMLSYFGTLVLLKSQCTTTIIVRQT